MESNPTSPRTVEDFQSPSSSITSPYSWESRRQLTLARLLVGDEGCTFVEICDVLRKSATGHLVYEKWKELARHLGVQPCVIFDIQKNFRQDFFSHQEVLYQVITSWRSVKASQATLVEFLRVLNCLDLRNAAEELEETFAPKVTKKLRFQKYIGGPPAFKAFVNSKQIILILSTLDSKITLKRIEDTSEVPMRFFQHDEFMGKSIYSKSELAVVITPNTREACQKALRLNAKTVLITEESQSKRRQNSNVKTEMPYFEADESKWEDLSTTFQESVLQHCEFLSSILDGSSLSELVYFATDEVKWEDLCPTFQESVVQHCEFLRGMESLDNILHDLPLIELIKDPGKIKLKKNLPPVIPFYIPRRLKSRCNVSKRLFTNGKDVYLFTGLERCQLTEFARNNPTDGSKSQIAQRHLSARFILLEMKSHFEKICNITERPVHCIHYEKDKLTLIKSNGNMSDIQEFIKEQQDELKEDEFLTYISSNCLFDQSKTPVCIGDSPGMGKSMLATNLGRHLVEKGHQVIYVIYEEFIKKVNVIRSTYDELLDAVIRALGSITFCTESEIGLIILKNLLQAGKIRFELFFDGFDEVSRDDIELAKECLSLMANSFQAARIWVTTRLHLLKSLENLFQVSGYKIAPFNEQDQTSFLVGYWSQKKSDLSIEKLSKLSEMCLTALKASILTSSDVDIAGVPLLCLLIAEVYEDSVLEYVDATNLISSSGNPRFDINTVAALYEALFLKKLSLCQKQLKTQYSVDDLMKIHVLISLQLLFPKWAVKFEKSLIQDNVLGDIEDAVLRVGILESMNNQNSLSTPRFLHRTFADYLIAWFVVQSLEKRFCDESDLCNFLFFDVGLSENRLRSYKKCGIELTCLRFTNKVICYFINKMISRCSTSSIETLIKKKEYRRHILDFAHCCVAEDFQNLFEFLHPKNAVEKASEVIFDPNLLFVLIDRCSLPFIKSVFGNYQLVSFFFQKDVSILNIAVRRGDYSIVEYLMHSQGFKEKVERMESAHILHDCIAFSTSDCTVIIQDKIQVIKLLVKLNSSVLEEVYNGRRPIHCKWVHAKLLMELMKCGADPLSLDNDGNCVLHIAAKYLEPVKYFSLMENIPKTTMEQLVKIKGAYGQTPLHELVALKDDVDKRILQLFAEYGADFNCCDQNNEALLHTAIQYGRCRPLLETLIECGANYSWVDKKNGETLLFVAAKNGNYDAVELLVEKGLDVNATDKDGRSPLSCTLLETGGNRFEIFDYLVMKGADESLLDFNKTVMFHKSIQQHDMDSLKWLIQKKTDINSKNEREETALHQLLCSFDNVHSNKCDLLLQFLLKNGADVNATNLEGQTPLLSALKQNSKLPLTILSLMTSHGALNSKEVATLALKCIVTESEGLDPVEYIKIANGCVQKGANLKHIYEKGNNLFHLAAFSGCIKGVNFLLKKVNAPDLNARNSNKDTPLHLAVEAQDDEELVKLLVENGGDVTPMNQSNYTVLHAAIKFGRWKTCKYLIEKGKLSHLFRNEEFVLFTSEYGNLDIFKMVCERYSKRGKLLTDIGNSQNDKNPERKSCLHMAVRGGNLDVVKHLLKSRSLGFIDCLDEPRMKDLLQMLVRDSKYNSLRSENEILKLLVKKRPSFLTDTDSSGKTPLLLRDVHVSLIKCMINLGADVRAVNENGDNVLHVAASYLSLKDYINLLKLIIRRGEGSLLSSRGRNNSTVLQRVAENMFAETAYDDVKNLLKLFVSQEVDFSAVDKDGDDVLVYAIRANCKAKNLERLLEKGAGNLNSKNKNQVTLVHWAAKYGNMNALEFLVREKKCSVNEMDDQGNTPVDYALKSNRHLIKFLTDHGGVSHKQG